MRITNRMISDNTMLNASAHLDKLSTLQQQLASGKAISKPSDNPTAVNQAMLLSNVLADQDQYVSNIAQTKNWLETTDSTIGSAQTILQRARVLAVEGASDSESPASRQATADEVDQLKEQLRGIANTQMAGRYLFAGSQTLVAPYPPFNPAGSPTVYPSPAPANIDNTDALTANIGPAQPLQYNATGTNVFGATTDPNSAFQVLDNLSQALRNNNGQTVSGIIGKLDARIDTMSQQRADVGGKLNRLSLLSDRYGSTEVSLKDLLSQNQDVDMPKVVSELTQTTQVYQASLAASARIIQPSLMDFLK